MPSYSKLRERHAKTLEIAQEEVLTCVGMIMYERLRRIYINLREEERACQVLAAVGVHALCRSFDTSVEKKQGISNLELLYQEISRAEKAKEHRREQKKLKKKKKKIEKKNGYRMCESTIAADSGSEGTREPEDDDDDDEEDDHDEAVDICEECDETHEMVKGGNVEAKQNKLKFKRNVYEVASLESNSDATEGDEEEVEHDDNTLNMKDLEMVICQAVTSKKKKRSKQKKSKNNNNTITKNINCNGKNKILPTNCNDMTTTLALAPNPLLPLHLSPTAVTVAETRATELTLDVNKCSDCLSPTHNCPCDVKDSGYGSEPNFSHDNSRVGSELSSPEGSEISCSDGFCNHEHEHGRDHTNSNENALGLGFIEMNGKELLEMPRCGNVNCDLALFSLQQMLDEDDCYADDDSENYIPQEEILKFQCQREQIEQKRQELRESLRQNFAKLCNKLSAGVETPMKAAGAKKANKFGGQVVCK